MNEPKKQVVPGIPVLAVSRYQNDPYFQRVVKTLMNILADGHLELSDLASALAVAELLHRKALARMLNKPSHLDLPE